MGLGAKIVEQEYHQQNANRVNNYIKLVILLAIAADVVNVVECKACNYYPKKAIDGAAAAIKLC